MAALKQPWVLSSRPQLPFSHRPRPLQANSPKRAPAVCALEDFDFRDGPREVTKPKFIRSEYPSLIEPVKSPEPSGTTKRRGRRPFRKATPLQAISGAMIGGGCSVLAFKATREAYQHLEMHPPAHNLPLNLTSEVNQLMLTMVTGFGGLVVCMFGVSCVGLVLLSVKLITAPKPPPSAP
ncbi:hypothetical protein KC19_4G108500 [Ceratodon purpureus]|uniref:Uncharacterized protein n=1 Tax=Ceratodon purpureus TaxID=3225 RepID=A0A8T0I9H3_CERPU|nr:hypothetical protein KC19_4G108500 [Ceratodon purpureus]